MDNQITFELNAQLKQLDDEILDMKQELDLLMRQHSEIKQRLNEGQDFKKKLQAFRAGNQALVNSHKIGI